MVNSHLTWVSNSTQHRWSLPLSSNIFFICFSECTHSWFSTQFLLCSSSVTFATSSTLSPSSKPWVPQGTVFGFPPLALGDPYLMAVNISYKLRTLMCTCIFKISPLRSRLHIQLPIWRSSKYSSRVLTPHSTHSKPTLPKPSPISVNGNSMLPAVPTKTLESSILTLFFPSYPLI